MFALKFPRELYKIYFKSMESNFSSSKKLFVIFQESSVKVYSNLTFSVRFNVSFLKAFTKVSWNTS